MRGQSLQENAYDGSMYDGLAKDIASGLPVSVAKAHTLKTAVDDHRSTGATASAIAERLTRHNVPHHNGRAWGWEDVRAMLDEWQWATADARQAPAQVPREQQSNR